MKKIVIALSLLPALAGAQVPQKLGYQGRLLKADGTPEAGVVSVTFSLFAAASGGSALWTEQQSLAISDGFYATLLGETASLNSVIDGSDRFLEVSVGGQPFNPRLQLGSVAHALIAGSARDVVGGKVEASSLTVGGKSVVDSSGRVDFGQLKACAAAGEILKWDGGAWHCAADQGLTGKVGPDQIAACGSAGDILKWDGSAWKCSPDAGGLTAVAVNAPLSGAGTTASPLTLAKAGAASDGYLSSGDYAAFAAKLEKVNAGAGIEVAGSALAPSVALKACAAGKVLKSSGTGWECQDDAAGLAGVAVAGAVAGDGTSGKPLTIKQDSITPDMLNRGGLVTDLARGVKASVSSGTVRGLGPTGDYAMEDYWATSTFPSSMTVDLGGAYEHLDQVVFETNYRGDTRWIPAYQGAGAYVLEYSENGTTWTALETVAPVNGDVFIHPIGFGKKARYFRLTVKAPATPGNAVNVGSFRVISFTAGDATRINSRRLYGGMTVDAAGNATISGTLNVKAGIVPSASTYTGTDLFAAQNWATRWNNVCPSGYHPCGSFEAMVRLYSGGAASLPPGDYWTAGAISREGDYSNTSYLFATWWGGMNNPPSCASGYHWVQAVYNSSSSQAQYHAPGCRADSANTKVACCSNY